MAKIVEYNPSKSRKTKHSRKHSSKSKSAKGKTYKRKTQKNPYSNPFTGKGKSGAVSLAKDGAMIAGGVAGAWASNKYLWAMLPTSVSASESMTKVRGAIPAVAGIWLAGRKSEAAKKLGLGLIAGGIFDMLAGLSNGMIPTLGKERVIFKPVPTRTVGMEAVKRNVASVGFEALKNAPQTVGYEAAKRTPFLRGSLSARSSLTGVSSI